MLSGSPTCKTRLVAEFFPEGMSSYVKPGCGDACSSLKDAVSEAVMVAVMGAVIDGVMMQ